MDNRMEAIVSTIDGNKETHVTEETPCKRPKEKELTTPTTNMIFNTKTSSLTNYNTTLRRQMDVHCMDNRMEAIVSTIEDDKSNPAQKASMETIYQQFVELQKNTEQQCRKILKLHLEFSGPVELWTERM